MNVELPQSSRDDAGDTSCRQLSSFTSRPQPATIMNRKTPTGRWAFVFRWSLSLSLSAQLMISAIDVDDAVSPVPMLARVEPMACRMVMRTSAVFLRTNEGPRRCIPHLCGGQFPEPGFR